MAFTQKVTLDSTEETRVEVVGLLEKLEQGGKWPQQACTTMCFLIPKNVTGERTLALMPTLIRWWEAMRAPEVAKWQEKYRVDWDAADGQNGGAQRTVWEILMEMERFKFQAREEDLGAMALSAGPGEGSSAGQSSCGVGLGDALQLPKEDIAGAVWLLRAPEASAVRRMRGGAAPDYHGHLARVKVELLTSAYCFAGCTE